MHAFLAALFALIALATFATATQNPAQRGRIVAITVIGSHRYAESQIAAASGLHVGDTVGREEIQAAADRLAQLGPFNSSRYRFASMGEDISVEFQVGDAPTVPVSFDNFPWFTDAELTAAVQQSVTLFDGTAPEQGSILNAMSEALQRLLATHGIEATIQHALMAQPGTDRMMQQFKVVGASLKINNVQFEDTLAAKSTRVLERLSDLVGKPYSRFTVAVFANEQVRPLYLERGHLRVQIGKPMVRFTDNPDHPLPDRVLVIVPIVPGPVYRWDGVEWSGNAVFGSAALDEFLGLKSGEIANGLRIAAAWVRVENEYGRRGFLDAKLDPEPIFDDAKRRVSYRVAITEGSPYRMGELVITGLSLAAERKLAEFWRLPRGQIFDRVFFDEFLDIGIKQAFAGFVVHYDEVGHWLRTNPKTLTVDVLLDFR